MKLKKIIFNLFLILFVSTFTTPVFSKPNQTRYISIKNAQLKETNKKFSKTIFTIDYAEKVNILSEQKSWAYICSEKDQNIKGWIPLSSLSKRKILKNSSVSANAKELALAGKGFSKEVEEKYFENSIQDIQKVNSIEKNKISEDDLILFIKEGNLNHD